MVARFLQEQKEPMDTGSLLLGFLHFFGNIFDPRLTGLSVSKRQYFNRQVCVCYVLCVMCVVCGRR